MMKLNILAVALATIMALTIAMPLPRTSPGISRRQTTSLSALVGTIMTTDPTPPPEYSTQTAHINSVVGMMPSEYQKTRSLGSWWHKTWDKIRNAIKSINIKISIPWDTLMSWLDKLSNLWTVQSSPNDPQDVMLVPPNGDMSKALHWHAPAPTPITIPDRPCGGHTGRMCQ